MMSRHKGCFGGLVGTAVFALCANIAGAADFAPSETYITYGTAGQTQLEISLDSNALINQGWSLSTDAFAFPVAAGGERQLTMLEREGSVISLNGEPQALGSFNMTGPDDQVIDFTDFSIAFEGRNNAMFQNGAHPIFEIVGSSLTIDRSASHVSIRGDIQLHAAAVEVGLDPQIGVIGEFTFTSGLEVVDVDQTIERTNEAIGGSQSPELPGADVIVGDLPNIFQWTAGTGPINGIRAYSVATTSCNQGTQPLDWFVGPNPRHPVIGQSVYRYMDGRFEHLGQSWLKHGFCALQGGICLNELPGCSPTCGGCCSSLGVGCSDPYSQTRNGQFGNMGPKREINPHMGTNLGNHAFAQGNTTLRGRIQVRHSDLDPALNPGAVYYVEGQYVAQDDAQFGDMTNDNNNASYRRVNVNPGNFNMTGSGGTVRREPALSAWRQIDNTVSQVNIDVEGDGRYILSSKASDNGDGTWHYEYALLNLNADRGARSFSVPMEPGVIASNMGFHDVDYHSGDPYDGTDWAVAEGGNSLEWSTQTFAQNQNANAIRWSTMYNFRFDANTGPKAGEITMGLFKTGGVMTMTGTAFVPEAGGPAIVHGADGASFVDHAWGGYVDSAAESSDGNNIDLGMNTFTLVFTEDIFAAGGGAVTAANFAVSETGGASAPTVTGVDASGNPAIEITLSRNITIQEWTTIQAVNVENSGGAAITDLGNQGAGVDEPDRVDIGYLPADVDNNASVTPFDLLRFRQIVNNVIELSQGVDTDFADTDRDGSVGPIDLLRFRQLINGTAGVATQAWNGASINSARP